jgi:tetratricopeptide (TPR) repeat protein
VQLADEGKPAEALEVMKTTEKISPYFPGIKLAIGMVYERMNRFDEAERHFQNMNRDYPDDPQVLSRLGHVQALRGDTAAAVQSLERSVELDPASEFNPYAELVNIYYRRMDVQRCVDLLTQWLGHHPDDTRARETLNMIRGGSNP